MGSGEILFRCSIEQGKVVQGILDMTDAWRKTGDAAKQAGSHSRDHEMSMQSLGRSAGRELSGMVMGWLSVGAAIGLGKQAISTMIEEMKRLHEQEEKATLAMGQAIAKAGDFASAALIKKRLTGSEYANLPLSMAERTEAYGAVRGAAPTLSADKAMALTAQVAKGKMAGYDVPGLAQSAGEIAKAAPELTAEQAADLAAFVQSLSGRHEKKITRGGWKAMEQFKGIGGTTEQGLGLMLASMEAGQGAEAFEKVIGETFQEPPESLQKQQFGKTLTPEQQAQKAFYALSPQDRLARLQSDPALRKALGLGAGVEAMFAKTPGRYAQAAGEAMRGRFLSSAVAVQMQDKDWASEMEKQRESARAEVAENLRGGGAPVEEIEIAASKMRQQGEPVVTRKLAEAGGYAASVFPKPSLASSVMTGVTAPATYVAQSNIWAAQWLMSQLAGQRDQPQLATPEQTKTVDLLGRAAEKLDKAADKLLGGPEPQRTPNVNAHVVP